MAKRDLQDIKEEVRARANIVDIIGGYTQLKPAGKNYTGLCPFHADKKPSFNVSTQLQSYRCWSCGEKGDVFTFLQKKENLTFIEALETLAQRVGVPFERSAGSQQRASEREEMHELNSLALSYYRDRITKSEESREYLAGRAILKETQDRFDIGFAPPDWDGLATYLQRRRANLAVAVKIGLIRERKDTSGYIDYYRNRVMFPIHDRTGNVAGFGGRAMGEEQPKYINSPQSDIFNKSGLLYGLYFARQKLGADVPPVFVEGYTDVVTTHQAGFTQCVATLGTAMTETHARMLVNYSRKVILCYDSDSAGINATLKGAAIWDAMGVEGAALLVARLPAGDDPDSMLKRGETAGFQRALDAAMPRVDFEIDLVLKRSDELTHEGRGAALGEIIPILATVNGSTNLDRYVHKLARLHPMYNLNPTRAMESIISDVHTYRNKTKNPTSGRARGHTSVEDQNGAPLQNQPPTPSFPPARPSALSAAAKAEYTLLRALFTSEWRSFILGRMTAVPFITDRARELSARILSTPPDSDGEISPLDVIRSIEHDVDGADEHYSAGQEPDELLAFVQLESSAGNHSAKLSDYLRDVVEDSATVLSNEPLNEATILGCIRRIEEHRAAQAIQDLKESLKREDLGAEQRTEFVLRLMELMRAQRGSAPGS